MKRRSLTFKIMPDYFFKISILLYALKAVELDAATNPQYVEDLEGVTDFRSVKLTWKYDNVIIPSGGFLVRYCEVGHWRSHLCNVRVINTTELRNNVVVPRNGDVRKYSALVDGLRLSTNYSFQVTPLEAVDHPGIRPREKSEELILSTKGFVAKVAKCQKDFTEVEIETGPFFGGKIGVEDATDSRCSLEGHPDSTHDTYTLIITHALCGSKMTDKYVESIIIANESPTIITQTSKRFQVVCDLLPESFTIKAIVNLPQLDNHVTASPVTEAIPPNGNMELIHGINVNNGFSNHLIDKNSAIENSARIYEKPAAGNSQTVVVVLVVMSILVTVIGATLWYMVGIRRCRRRSSDSSDQASVIYETPDNQYSGQDNDNINTRTGQEPRVTLTSIRQSGLV